MGLTNPHFYIEDWLIIFYQDHCKKNSPMILGIGDQKPPLSTPAIFFKPNMPFELKLLQGGTDNLSAPIHETKRRSVWIPANRAHQRWDYQTEWRARVGGAGDECCEKEGRSFRLLIAMVPTAAPKTDRLEVNLALYLSFFRIRPCLPLPHYLSLWLCFLPPLSVIFSSSCFCLLYSRVIVLDMTQRRSSGLH